MKGRDIIKKGYIQIYTGNGKGKTTAALGLSLRAVCAGQKVFFGQFVKGMEYSEMKAVKFLDGFELKQYGRKCFIVDKPTDEDIRLAVNGLKELEKKIRSGDYDVVVMDELNIAIFFKLFSTDDVIQVLNKKHPKTEIIITGRYAPEELVERADLVTEMKEIKHYYQQRVQARVGIEK